MEAQPLTSGTEMPEHHDYNTGELTLLLGKMNETLNDIKTQVISTNGRVKKLEMWRMFLLGAWAVISVFIPFLYMQISSRVDAFTSSVDTRIMAAIEHNNDKYFEK